MFSTLRTRFGIPGVISVIALVFAMFGGAYAASNSSNAGKATASAKAKKGPRGPKGATGPAGPAGAQGPAGPAGAKGDAGANGSNGAAGATGPEGSPWTAGGTLPAGKTETGTWAATFVRVGEGVAQTTVPISFPIPLAAAPTNHVYLNYQETLASVGSGGCELQLESTTAKPIAPRTLSVSSPGSNPKNIPRLSNFSAAPPSKKALLQLARSCGFSIQAQQATSK
jgi:hypothetical protein